MMNAKTAISLGIVLAAWLLLLPSSLYPCGPVFDVAVFVSSRPDDLSAFANGNLGVLQPSYARTDLLIAWRVLSNQPLTQAEKDALLPRPTQVVTEFPLTPMQVWIKARNRVPGFENSGLYVETDKVMKDYQFFPNCNDDAFTTAAATLENLVAKHRIDSPEVKDWTAAQNMVFQNCSGGPAIPAALPASSPAELQADRAYQIAAANFYATNYDLAATQFSQIAADKTSPWRDYGLLLSARAYIRKGTLGALLKETNGGPQDPSAFLEHAEKLLKEVIADPELGRVHASATRLLSFVVLHLRPQQQAQLLAVSLQHPSIDPQFGQQVTDYFRLIDDYRAPDDEMADWITAVRDSSRSPEGPLQRWEREPKSIPWLLAALTSASANSPDLDNLVTAALAVPADSPAYVTAQYYSARLRYQRGSSDLARRQIDSFLQTRPKALALSALNAFSILRSLSANSLTDFTHFAAIPLAALSWDDGSQPPPENSCAGDHRCPQYGITTEAANRLNRMPVTMLLQVAQDPNAPPVLKHGSAIVAWERSVLLDDFRHADIAAQMLARMDPEDAKDLADYRRARSDSVRRFAAVLVMLKWPGARPEFFTDAIRDDPMRKLNNFRLNWWCKELSSAQDERLLHSRQYGADLSPRFLTVSERESAAMEIRKLGELGSAPNYFGRVVTSWAKTHGDDPRVPEALHLTVRATRYGCTDESTAAYSKAAFLLLHRNYPRSEWAKRTPYYFK